MSLQIAREVFEEFGFTEISDVQQGVFKCVKKYSEIEYSVHFFDLHNDVDRVKSFKDVTNDLIGKEYYKNSGAIQWNYYYYFVFDDLKAKKFEESHEKSLLEKNKSFARKFLYSESQLMEHLRPIKFKEIISSDSNDIDLLESWQKHLFEKGLQEIVTEKTFKGTIGCLQSKQLPFKPFESESFETTESEDTSREKAIAELKLTSFREYPLQRSYEFGKFNLFFGPNGTGKTSLFEAIELFYCGATKRSNGMGEENALIEVRLKGNDEFENYVPSKAGNYNVLNERERKWYGRQSGKSKSLLYDSFNRFNFYNTDSAFLLSHENESEEDIEKSFSALVLGDELIDLDMKIDKVLTEFTKDVRRQEKKVDEIQKLKEIEKDKIAKYSSSDDELKIKESVLEKTLTDKINIIIKNFRDKDELSNIVSILGDYKTKIETVSTKLNSTDIKTYELYSERLDQLKEFYKELKKKSSEIKKVEGQKLNTLNVKQSKIEKSKILKNFLRYREDKNFKSLSTYSNKLQTAYEKELIIKKKMTISGDLNLEILSFFDDSATFKESKIKVLEELNNIDKSTVISKVKLEKIRDKIGRLEQVVTEILVLGKNYSDLNDQISNCPMCTQKINKDDFMLALEREEKADENIHFEEVVNEINDLRDKKNITERTLDFLQKTEEFLVESFEIVKVQDFEHIIQNLKKEHDEARGEVIRLETLKEYFKDREMNQDDFLSIERDMILSFTDSMQEKSLQHLKDSLNLLAEEVEDQAVRGLSFDQEILEIKEARNILYKKIKSSLNMDDSKIEIENKLEEILSVEESVFGIVNVVKKCERMKFDEIYDNLSNSLTLINSWISFLSNYKTNFSLVSEAKKTFNMHEESLHIVKKEIEISNYIIESLEELNLLYGKKEALDNFIQKNRKVINNIFKKIHSPDEFSGLETSTLSLRKKINGRDVTLNEVSTGQRSALALSIFLSLNLSLKNAPPVILIDDPVSFVDDMNTLSFLDFLREVIINGERQVFFATANHKIASLIEKKFDFLGEDNFRKFSLHR